jgi:hypothetical protein
MGETKLAIEYYELALRIDPSIEFARDNLEKLTNRTKKDKQSQPDVETAPRRT